MTRNDEARLRRVPGDLAMIEWLEVGEPRHARQLARRIAIRFPDADPLEMRRTIHAELLLNGVSYRTALEAAKKVAGK